MIKLKSVSVVPIAFQRGTRNTKNSHRRGIERIKREENSKRWVCFELKAKRCYDLTQFDYRGQKRTRNKKLFNWLVKESKRKEHVELMKMVVVQFD